jgi:predicted HTH transcriptional regulator
MVDVSEIARFTPGERTLRLVMDIAAALERYRIVMEGPSGVRLRKLNHIRTIRGTTAIEGNTLTEDQVTDIIAGKRPRTLKARGESQGGKKKVVRKGGKKTVDRLLELIRGNPKITFAEMVSAAGISRSAIQKHIERLKDAQRLRRVGPDKGGHWEVIEKSRG